MDKPVTPDSPAGNAMPEVPAPATPPAPDAATVAPRSIASRSAHTGLIATAALPNWASTPTSGAQAIAPAGADSALAHQVGASARRKQHAAAHPAPGALYGLGMMGLVGWAVAVPTLAGAALGWWLDIYHPGRHGWTLALLAAGLTLGCFNAWRWVAGELSTIDKEAHHDEP